MKIFCKHDWILGHMVREYHDYSGFRVQVWRCHCPKCGKWKNRKYW